MKLVSLVARKRVEEEKKGIIIGVGIVYFLINIFYVFNVIPPVPLVLKSGGVYHSISWQADHYLALGEKRSFLDFFTQYPLYHRVPGEPVYVAVAVYAPAALSTTIVHDWQYYNEKASKWQSVTKVPVAIVGGRENGYRSYSVKQNVVTGFWRVDIKTATNKVIGRLKFEVVEDGSVPNLVQDVY